MINNNPSKGTSLDQGLIVAHFGAKVEILGDNGNRYHCSLKRNGVNVTTGDKITYKLLNQDTAAITTVLARNSSFYRGSNNKEQHKLIAANLEQMLIVIAPIPKPIPYAIAKYIVLAKQNHLTPIIVCNKNDLGDYINLKQSLPELAQYAEFGIKIITINTLGSSDLKPLQEILTNKTSILVGQSGVGKSTIVQKLTADPNIVIGDLSKTQGRHTTTHTRLYKLPGNASIIDIPGINNFGLNPITKNQLLEFFPEIKAATTQCKFSNCQHLSEPSCQVLAQLENGKININRYQAFCKIAEEINQN